MRDSKYIFGAEKHSWKSNNTTGYRKNFINEAAGCLKTVYFDKLVFDLWAYTFKNVYAHIICHMS